MHLAHVRYDTASNIQGCNHVFLATTCSTAHSPGCTSLSLAAHPAQCVAQHSHQAVQCSTTTRQYSAVQPPPNSTAPHDGATFQVSAATYQIVQLLKVAASPSNLCQLQLQVSLLPAPQLGSSLCLRHLDTHCCNMASSPGSRKVPHGTPRSTHRGAQTYRDTSGANKGLVGYVT